MDAEGYTYSRISLLTDPEQVLNFVKGHTQSLSDLMSDFAIGCTSQWCLSSGHSAKGRRVTCNLSIQRNQAKINGKDMSANTISCMHALQARYDCLKQISWGEIRNVWRVIWKKLCVAVVRKRLTGGDLIMDARKVKSINRTYDLGWRHSWLEISSL